MSIVKTLIPLTEFQRAVLNGLMLGDGHLTSDSKNSHILVLRSIKDIDYIKYEMSVFNNYLSPKKLEGPFIRNNFDKRSNITSKECGFATMNNPCFNEFRKAWYGPERKTIPADLELNAITIAHWIADDGHIYCNKLPYRFVVEISTHSFSEDEVNLLAKKLNERYNEEFLVKAKKRKDKTYYIIKFYDSACRAVFKDIDPYFKMIRKRLWDAPSARFYSNPPATQVRKKANFLIRKNKLKEIIDAGGSFNLKKLAELLGYDYVVHTTMMRLLQPYLDAKVLIKELDNLNNHTITFKVVK
jgi:hypothetical protein